MSDFKTVDGHYVKIVTTPINKMTDVEIVDELESYNHLFGKYIEYANNHEIVMFHKEYSLMGYKRLNTIYRHYNSVLAVGRSGYHTYEKRVINPDGYGTKPPFTASCGIGHILHCFRNFVKVWSDDDIENAKRDYKIEKSRRTI